MNKNQNYKDNDLMYFRKADLFPSLEKCALSKNFDVDFSKGEVIDKRTGKITQYDIDSKILIYEDRQNTWFFDIANKLKEDNEAGFIILMIATSYLEGNQQFRDGTKSSNTTNTINKALDRIFRGIDEDSKELIVRDVRHGFSHDGITRKRIYINASMSEIFDKKAESLVINPHIFLDKVKQDFKDYIKKIKDSDNIEDRQNFEKYWNSFKGN